MGLFLPHAERHLDGKTPHWSDILAIAQRAEEIGFDSIWVSDHLISQINPRVGPTLRFGPWECWSLLAALAATTKRVELGPLVSSTSFRSPQLLAKMADTVDEISDGRLILGLGAGWHEHEYHAFGYPFDHRASRFEEALVIIHTLLHEGRIDFDGAYYQARECEIRPRGPRAAGPPIMIGTVGERMLRLTAKYADLWNVWFVFGDSYPRAIGPILPRVDAACEEVGRDPDTLGRTVAIAVASPGMQRGIKAQVAGRVERMILRRVGIQAEPISGPAGLIAKHMQQYADLGVSHIQVMLRPNTLAGLEAFAPVLELIQRTPAQPARLAGD